MTRLLCADRKASLSERTNRTNPKYEEKYLWMYKHLTLKSGCHSCQLRKGNSGFKSHRLPNIYRTEDWKNVCCDIQTAGSEFDVNTMKAWIRPALYQWFSLLVVLQWCEEIFSWNCRPLDSLSPAETSSWKRNPCVCVVLSQAVIVDRTMYISGQLGMDVASGKLVDGGVQAQAKQVKLTSVSV